MAKVTKVVKILPIAGDMITAFSCVENFDKMQRAFHSLFDSALLTKDDYEHILKVISSKLPIYAQGLDAEAFKSLVIGYVKHGYPDNPDLERAVFGFIDGFYGINPTEVTGAVALILKRMKTRCSDFVGLEAQKKFYLTPTPESDFLSLTGRG